MAFSSMSRIVTSVCRLSASSPVNMAWKYGLHADKITRWAKILRSPTMRTTSQSSRCLRSTLMASRVSRGCLSEVWAWLGGDGGRCNAGSMGPIISRMHHAPPKRPLLEIRSTTLETQGNLWEQWHWQTFQFHSRRYHQLLYVSVRPFVVQNFP